MQNHYMKSIERQEEETSSELHRQPTNHGKTYNQASDDWNSHYDMIDSILEKEKQFNKTETWTKLDKMHKILKLNEYAEKYASDKYTSSSTPLSVEEIHSLKCFLTECIEKSKLHKTKEIDYDKIKHEIKHIPALQFDADTRVFTLKNLDQKRISTVKSLGPKTNSSSSLASANKHASSSK